MKASPCNQKIKGRIIRQLVYLLHRHLVTQRKVGEEITLEKGYKVILNSQPTKRADGELKTNGRVKIFLNHDSFVVIWTNIDGEFGLAAMPHWFKPGSEVVEIFIFELAYYLLGEDKVRETVNSYLGQEINRQFKRLVNQNNGSSCLNLSELSDDELGLLAGLPLCQTPATAVQQNEIRIDKGEISFMGHTCSLAMIQKIISPQDFRWLLAQVFPTSHSPKEVNYLKKPTSWFQTAEGLLHTICELRVLKVAV